MKDLRQETVDTYNKSAKALADHFQDLGARVKDIDLVFKLLGNPKKARVVEIGCGDGRDGKEIAKRAGWYLGFDISKELIKLAREHAPGVKFEVTDVSSFKFPKNLDAVFAFASLLHMDKEEVKDIFERVHAALNPGGVFYISVKYSPKYTRKIKKDEHGRRLFYYYNSSVMRKLAGKNYEVAEDYNKTHGNTEWLEIAFRKK